MSDVQIVSIVIGAVVVAVIVLLIIRAVFKRQKEKAQETERILNTPVDKIGDPDLEDLKDKYDSK